MATNISFALVKVLWLLTYSCIGLVSAFWQDSQTFLAICISGNIAKFWLRLITDLACFCSFVSYILCEYTVPFTYSRVNSTTCMAVLNSGYCVLTVCEKFWLLCFDSMRKILAIVFWQYAKTSYFCIMAVSTLLEILIDMDRLGSLHSYPPCFWQHCFF